jgi:hypothetical protein
MKTVSKALLGTIAAGAMVASSATPALADHRHNDGISTGDIIAGALIIGGIAAVATAASHNDRGYDGNYAYDRAGYNNGGYNNGGYGNGYDRDARYRSNPRQAVEQCVAAAERYAGSRGMRADVTDIREVKDTRYGFQVKGRIAVQGNGRGWNRGNYSGNDRYGQGWGGDYRGYNDRVRGYDSGSFKCKFERGRITDLDIDGVRGF